MDQGVIFKSDYLRNTFRWMQWLTPVNLALWEAEAGGSRGQGFETSLTNVVKPRLYLKIQKLARYGGSFLPGKRKETPSLLKIQKKIGHGSRRL